MLIFLSAEKNSQVLIVFEDKKEQKKLITVNFTDELIANCHWI